MQQIFSKIWLKTLVPNVVFWGIGFSILQPLLDKIWNEPVKSFNEYVVDGVVSGFFFSLMEATIALVFVKKVIYKYQLNYDVFQFGKPYQKTQSLYTDIPKILQKIESWNRNSYQKFLIKKIEPQFLEIHRGMNIIHLYLDYGKVTIQSRHRYKRFYFEQGQNIENVELLFSILQN